MHHCGRTPLFRRHTQDNDVAKGLLLDVPKSAVELVPPAECTALAPAFNPYPAMGAPKPNWCVAPQALCSLTSISVLACARPRGFPLQLIKTPCSSDAASVLGGTASASNLNDVGVFQVRGPWVARACRTWRVVFGAGRAISSPPLLRPRAWRTTTRMLTPSTDSRCRCRGASRPRRRSRMGAL